MLLAQHGGLGSQVRHLLEGLDELRTTIGIAAVIERVHAEEYVAGPEDLRPRQRIGQENGISRRDVGDGNPLRDLGPCAALGDLQVAGQRRAAKRPQIHGNDPMLADAGSRRQLPGALQFPLVPLSVGKRERKDLVSFVQGNGENRGGIDPAAQQHHRFPAFAHARSIIRGRPPRAPCGRKLERSSLDFLEEFP